MTSQKLTSSSNNKCFSGLSVQREDVIARDSVFSCTWNVGIARSASASNHNELGVQDSFGFVLHNGNNVVSIFEVSETVDVLDFFVTQVHACDPVDGLDVVLDRLSQFCPVDLDALRVLKLPTISFRILQRHYVSYQDPLVDLKLCTYMNGFSQQGRLMHELFGDAADVYTGSA